MQRTKHGEAVKLDLGVEYARDDGHSEETGCAVFTCKRCDAQWSIVLDPVEKTIDKGSANALLAHARAHVTKPRMRRL